MRQKDDNGQFVYGQHDIERETGLSRPYIRKLAKQIHHQFPRNGVEVKGTLCMCTNCGSMFRKPPSRVKRAKNQFCDEECRIAWTQGASHPNWKGGKSVTTFSKWITNKADYQWWKEQVLAKCDYKCVITGETEDLDCHHIKLKSIEHDQALNPDNGIVLSKKAHRKIHRLMDEGRSFQEAVDILKEEYKEVANV